VLNTYGGGGGNLWGIGDSQISVVARSIILEELRPLDKCSIKMEEAAN
jgi:hypothetical protein